MRGRIVLLLFFAFFCVSLQIRAQEEIKADTIYSSDFVYWEDETDDNSRVMNKTLFKDNWFFGIHAGAVYNWGTNASKSSVMSQLRPVFGLSVGKRVSPYMGFRAQVMFANNRGTLDNNEHQTWNALQGYGDVLFDFTNLLMNFRENRRFNFIGMIGIGGEHTFSYKKIDQDYVGARIKVADGYLGLRLGLMARFKLSKVWDFTMETTNTWLNDAYDGLLGKNSYDRHFNLMAGLVYHFKNHDGYRDFSFARYDRERYTVLREEVNKLREEAVKLKDFMENNPDVKVVNSQQVNTLISFEEGSYQIDEMQQVNVFTTAEAMKRLPDADLYITVLGHESYDADLFMQRAEAIRRMLMSDYGIPAGRIFAEKNPAVVEAIDKTLNCIIFYINE